MSQILAFSQRMDFKTLLEVKCKTYSGFTPLIYQTLEEFRSILNIFESIDVLVVDEPEDKVLFLSILRDVNLHAPRIKHILMLSREHTGHPQSKSFPKEEVSELLEEMKRHLAPQAEPEKGYISIPMDSLVHIKVLPFDLFIKISEEKYVRRIPAHESIDSETINGFIAKGISELYFERRHNRDFSLMLINNMINKVETEYVTIDKKLEATSEVFETTHQIVGKLGFKPKVVAVCESVMNQIFEDVAKGKDNFARFLDQLRSQTDLPFRYRLMELTSFIATQMIDEMEEGGKREKIKKIVFASLFCDVTLKDNTQIHIRKADQLQKFSPAEQKEISEHALRASDLVNQYSAAPVEASLIIKQHHGSLTGVGIPKEISPKILPLTKCLMAAQEISYHILMEAIRHPIDVLSDVKLNYIDTPLEDYFILFEKTCLDNLHGGRG